MIDLVQSRVLNRFLFPHDRNYAASSSKLSQTVLIYNSKLKELQRTVAEFYLSLTIRTLW